VNKCIRSLSIRSLIRAVALLLLPIVFLSTQVFGQNNCDLTPFNGPCNYKTCKLSPSQCSDYNNNEKLCTMPPPLQTFERQLAVNNFSCTKGTPTQACNPVMNAMGNAALTNCTISFSCSYNQKTGACTLNIQMGTCQAPYYQTGTCPPP
jgi:hypothetical protein